MKSLRPLAQPQAPPKVPASLGRKHRGKESTQQAFGRFFVDLVREAPDVADRVVTVSPDDRRHWHDDDSEQHT